MASKAKGVDVVVLDHADEYNGETRYAETDGSIFLE
jgi:hypothetical protein